MSENTNLQEELILCVQQFTDIIPSSIYFRDNSKAVIVEFEDTIPKLKTRKKIKVALRIFGEVLMATNYEPKPYVRFYVFMT